MWANADRNFLFHDQFLDLLIAPVGQDAKPGRHDQGRLVRLGHAEKPSG